MDDRKVKRERLWEVKISNTLHYKGETEPDEETVILPIKRFIKKAVNACGNYLSIGSSVKVDEVEWDDDE